MEETEVVKVPINSLKIEDDTLEPVNPTSKSEELLESLSPEIRTLIQDGVKLEESDEESPVSASIVKMPWTGGKNTEVENKISLVSNLRAQRDLYVEELKKLSNDFKTKILPQLDERGVLEQEISGLKGERQGLTSLVNELKREISTRRVQIASLKDELEPLDVESRKWSFWHELLLRTLRITLLRQQASTIYVTKGRRNQKNCTIADRQVMEKLKKLTEDLDALNAQLTQGKIEIKKKVEVLEKAFLEQTLAKQALENRMTSIEEMKEGLKRQEVTWMTTYLPQLRQATETLSQAKTLYQSVQSRYDAKIEWENLSEEMIEIRRNVELDMTVPDWTGPTETWAEEIVVNRTRYDIVPGSQLSWDKPMELSPKTIIMKLWIAKKPFDCGTFRQAFYALDDQGQRWVVKKFHIERGSQVDFGNAERHVRENRLVHATIKQFESELRNVGIVMNLNYINVFVLQEVQSSRIWMMEEMLEQWDRWQNNVDFVADNQGGRLFSAHSHFTYLKYDGKLIVTDHQGFQVSDTEYLLSDPGIHLLQPELGLFKSIQMDLGADRGGSGERDFLNFHVCNEYCKLLKLRDLKGVDSFGGVMGSPLDDSEGE